MLLFDNRLSNRKNVAVVASDILLRGDDILFSLFAIVMGYDILGVITTTTRYIKIFLSFVLRYSFYLLFT